MHTVLTFFGKKKKVFLEYLVILLLPTVPAFLDYLHNLRTEQCSWVTFTVSNQLIPYLFTTENFIQ